MHAETKTIEGAVSREIRSTIGPAPSLRVPVTARNRALLRRMRAAELLAWETGRACQPPPQPSAPPTNHRT